MKSSIIEKTENKKGYKKTKLGWIPEDWEVVKLGNIATEINDKVGTKQRTPMSLSAGKGFVAQAKKFGKDIAGKQYAQYTCLPPRTFAYNKGNSLKYPQGCIYQQPFNEEVAVPNVFICFALDKKRCNNNFYEQLFKNNAQGKELFKYINSGVRNDGLLNLNDNNFFKIKLVLPPLNEQEKIAEILSAWDDGIETLEKLIEQKKILKNSLAQKYFHRKNNLFQLKQHKLGELFKNRKDTNCCDLELLSVCDGLGIVPRSQLNAKDNSNKDKSKYLKVCVGDLAYNTMRMWQGRCGVSSYEGIVSPAYTVCIPKDNIDVDYMYYLFKTPHMIHDFWRYSQGIVDDTLNLKFNNFEVIKVWIPDKETQTKIAKLLKSYDEEIQILNSKLEKLKEQEKGLMQKLLTGQIRVKV